MNAEVNEFVRAGSGAPPPDRTNRSGHAWEIIAVVALGACFIVLGLESATVTPPYKLLIIAALLCVFAFACRAAFFNASRVAAAEQKRDTESLFKVTELRLDTLRAADVPRDVISALRKLTGAQPMTKEAFLNLLALSSKIDLGAERTNEYKDKILKYTKVDTHL